MFIKLLSYGFGFLLRGHSPTICNHKKVGSEEQEYLISIRYKKRHAGSSTEIFEKHVIH